MSHIILFLRGTAGSFDAALPLLARLAEAKITVNTVILNRKVGKIFDDAQFYSDALHRFSNVVRFDHIRPGFIRRLLTAWYMLGLAFFGLVRKQVVILNPPNMSGIAAPLNRLLNHATLCVEYMNMPGVCNFADRAISSGPLFDLLAAKGDKKGEVKCAHRAIAFTDESAQAMRTDPQYETSEFYVIGIPRLMGDWEGATRDLRDKAYEAELKRLGYQHPPESVITLITNYPLTAWFPDEKTYFRLFHDSIDVIRKHFCDVPILAKVKPGMERFFVNEISRYAGDSAGVHLTHCPLPVLAPRSRLGITINEGSGVFEFVFSGVPTLEYACYSNAWIEHQPQGSSWRSLPGMSYVETRDLLDRILGSISDGSFPIQTQEFLKNYFGHRENLQLFSL